MKLHLKTANTLLEKLLADSHAPCTLPVVKHSKRLKSGARGIGLPLLRKELVVSSGLAQLRHDMQCDYRR